MNWFHAIILGIVEGLTEYLPVSSTGHLTVTEKLLGYNIEDPGITAFTAVIQSGAILAAVLYFRKDIVRIAAAWFRGITNKEHREDPDYRLGWGVIVATLVTVVVALLFKNLIEGAFRSLWVVLIALIGWSLVMFLADRMGKQVRGEHTVGVKDSLILGLVQCISLAPGVSRSGATISGALFRGIDRVTATRLSFFMGIPTLLAAGGMQAVTKFDDIAGAGVGWGPTIVGIVVSFIVAYASIAWLLKYVSKHNFTAFVIYRVALGLVIAGLLLGGVIQPV